MRLWAGIWWAEIFRVDFGVRVRREGLGMMVV